ncbi:hypothetical protein [Paenibacillus sp. IHBB 3054]|uniref:hypothetical protein n=1 Tax=Paenibacillus sp. IHBB 3054 TaxID=3425689 RepID=UPI003F67365E
MDRFEKLSKNKYRLIAEKIEGGRRIRQYKNLTLENPTQQELNILAMEWEKECAQNNTSQASEK